MTKLPSEIANETINYRGYAATRRAAYAHALAACGSHLSAERIAFGLSTPALTEEQIARYVPFSNTRASS